MIVVTAELWSAVDGSKTQLARMHICNDGRATIRNPRLGDYIGESFVGRDAETLAKGRVSKRAEVRGWRRHDYHVWNLVRRMLTAMGYVKGAISSPLPLVDDSPDEVADLDGLLSRLGYWEMQTGRVAQECMLPREFNEWGDLHRDLTLAIEALRPTPAVCIDCLDQGGDAGSRFNACPTCGKGRES